MGIQGWSFPAKAYSSIPMKGGMWAYLLSVPVERQPKKFKTF